MSNNLSVFNFGGLSDIRVLDREGEAWFVGKDVAEVLGYANPSEALQDHCKATQKVGGSELLVASDYAACRAAGHSHNDAIRQWVIIPERDVYRLVMRSKLPAAEKFEDWVVGTVLPSIRKTGGYSVANSLPDFSNPAAAARAWAAEFEEKQNALSKLTQTTKELETAKPKVDYFDHLVESGSVMSWDVVAKELNFGFGRNKMLEILRTMKVLQSSGSSRNVPYQNFINRGYFEVKQKYLPTGGTVSVTMVTNKGIDWLLKTLKPYAK